MKKFKIVITDLWKGALEPERAVLNDIADVIALDAHHEQELIGKIENADGIICNTIVSLNAQILERLTRCKVIARCGVGFDSVDVAFARKRNIPVANVPDYGTEEVADSALALTLSLVRAVTFLNSRLRAGFKPWNYNQAVPLQRLRGEIFGVVGFGSIGMAAALRAKAFGMKIVCFDPFMRPGINKVFDACRATKLEELLGTAYVVSLHCNLSKDTAHLINVKTLAQMRRGAFLVNTARGGLVNTNAILDAITSGQLAGVGFDVLEKEPPDENDPLLCAWRDPEHPAHHRVIINPHTAFYSEQSRLEMRTKTAQICRAALLGEPIPNVVNG